MEHYFERADLKSRAKNIEDVLEEANSQLENVDFLMTVSERGIYMAKNFLEKTLPDLRFIGENEGVNSPVYKDMCNVIALYADTYMKPQLQFNSLMTLTSDYQKDKMLVDKITIENYMATKQMSDIMALKISKETKALLKETLKIINAIESRLNKKTGCFIATCVYGDYDNENVLVLRSFRDNVLSKYMLGKIFVRVYYRISPNLITIIGSSSNLKLMLKFLLNKLIIKIR